MPTIAGLTLNADEVDVSDIQLGGMFNPTAVPGGSLESLNGGLDTDNYAGGANSLPAWSFRYGTHAAGGSWGSNRREFVVAQQKGGSQYVWADRIHSVSVGSRFVLPWEAKLLIWTFSAFCCHDATGWSAATALEHWDWRVRLDGSELTSLRAVLPAGRISADPPDLVPLVDDPGIHQENRWRFVSEFGAHRAVAKGVHKVDLSTWASVISPDQKLAKLIIPAWHMSVLAIR